METRKSFLILGIGNVLWADEGFGVRAVEALHRHYAFPANVRLMDGGTQGIYLVQHVSAADVVVVFDAIDYGCAPGTLRLIEDDAVPEFMAAKKMSLHQTGFQEVLAMARLLGSHPERLLLVGVQPAELEDYGGSLRPPVRAQVAPAMAAAVAYLEGLGVAVTRRDTPLPEGEGLAPPALALEPYEAERPSETVACRVGDARVLGSPDYQIRYHPVPLEGPTVQVDVAHHLDKYR